MASPVFTTPRKPLSAPKDLETSDLQRILEGFMEKQGTRDLTSSLRELSSSITWKKSARPALLSKFSHLFEDLCDLSGLGILPAKRLSLALAACHNDSPCNFSAMPLDSWAEDLSGTLRATISKIRELKTDSEACRRCLNKARS